jgi:hypothetical protein
MHLKEEEEKEKGYSAGENGTANGDVIVKYVRGSESNCEHDSREM